MFSQVREVFEAFPPFMLSMVQFVLDKILVHSRSAAKKLIESFKTLYKYVEEITDTEDGDYLMYMINFHAPMFYLHSNFSPYLRLTSTIESVHSLHYTLTTYGSSNCRLKSLFITGDYKKVKFTDKINEVDNITNYTINDSYKEKFLIEIQKRKMFDDMMKIKSKYCQRKHLKDKNNINKKLIIKLLCNVNSVHYHLVP